MVDHARISPDVLARYAVDAALEVAGVHSIQDGPLPRQKGVRIAIDEATGAVAVELHLALHWGTSFPAAGRAVQERVVEYLGRMADVRPSSVDVVVASVVS